MRFIMIKGYDDKEVAINTANISAIKTFGKDVCLLMSGVTPIITQFTSIADTVDYIQRAPSISLGAE
mgnify:CR=1 FL=1|tara:strand:+ start:705 stop:905 length:201 start_codon:yes stop_codon:yes gene_type:complete